MSTPMSRAPRSDFTYHLMQWHMPANDSGAGTASLLGCDLSALGIPTEKAYVDAYVARTEIGFHLSPDAVAHAGERQRRRNGLAARLRPQRSRHSDGEGLCRRLCRAHRDRISPIT